MGQHVSQISNRYQTSKQLEHTISVPKPVWQETLLARKRAKSTALPSQIDDKCPRPREHRGNDRDRLAAAPLRQGAAKLRYPGQSARQI